MMVPPDPGYGAAPPKGADPKGLGRPGALGDPALPSLPIPYRP